MKNIHLIPTHKPSKLYRTGAFILLDSRVMPHDTIETINQHIYITSDEKPKEGDWFLTDDKRVEKCAPDWRAREWHRKIILTTDQDLIKDGVQPIDDEFLEWFVKNPSCEKVKVDKNWNYPLDKSWEYKLRIIPQEEQKQHLIDIMRGDEELGLYEEPKQDRTCTNNCSTVCGECQIFEPKQETLEEAAKKYKDLKLPDDLYDAFIQGAEWQQERMYSEEEVLGIFHEWFCYQIDEDVEIKLSFQQWFEQFKKK